MKSKPITLSLHKDQDEGETKERGPYNEYCYVQYLFAIHSITWSDLKLWYGNLGLWKDSVISLYTW